MTFRRLRLLVPMLALASLAVRCGDVDLKKSVEVSDILSGYYDDGVVAAGDTAGQNRLLPSITFKLKNTSTQSIVGVMLTVSFWHEGDDGEKGSKEVRGISGTALEAGAMTEEITVRSDVGYTSAAARADFFTLSTFKDWTAKVFAKRGGKIVPIGEFKIDRRLIPHRDAPRP